MMGQQTGVQDRLFYSFNLDDHVPRTHLLRGIDHFFDLGDLRKHLAPFYSHTGRPSIDPELMVRKVIGTNAYGSGVYFQMLLWLKNNGLDPEKDVKIVETGFPASADAIRSGRVDAGPLVQPFALLAEEKGDVRKLFALSEVQSPTVQIFEGCSQAYADKNPEVVKAYVKDLQLAMSKLLEDRSLAVAVASEVTRAPKELLDKYLFTNKDFAHAPDMAPNLKSIQETIDLQHKAGFLAKPVDVSKFVREDIKAPIK